MDWLDRGKAAPESAQQHTTGGEKKPPSSSELMASAKVITDAASSKFSKAEGEGGGGNTKEFDKAKLFAAADDMVEAAQHYCKTDGKSYGTYVEKAHGYLHNQEKPSHKDSTPPPSSDSSASSEGMDYGKYFKKAEGFFNK